jgi:hypothetical protein
MVCTTLYMCNTINDYKTSELSKIWRLIEGII